ncbi:MAG: MASE4 domain-containing protein [Alphaproteobacteria bacterium]|nr:MASE4 domain-containing protein [Alphaproteobacteria bacterium]
MSMVLADAPRQAAGFRAPGSDWLGAIDTAEGAGIAAFIRRRQERLSLAIIIVSVIAFIAAVPFAARYAGELPAFIPAYEAGVVVIDLITAVLLFGEFSEHRTAPLLILAAGYLFAAIMIVPHAISYPGLLSPSGWLGGGGQTTAWLYIFWHGGFPLFVIAYAVASRARVAAIRLLTPATLLMAILCLIGVCGLLTTVAIDADHLLPVIMAGSGYTPAMRVIVDAVLGLTLVALFCLICNRPYALLDLWLMVVMNAWLLDIALSAAINAHRFDLGFYAGRAYGLLAATFVLVSILVEGSKLRSRLAVVTVRLEEQARALDSSVQQGARQLAASNQRLAAIIDASPVAIFMIDPNGLVQLWTPAAEHVFGYSEAEALGRVPPYLSDEQAADMRGSLALAASDPQARGFREHQRVRKDGAIIDISVRWARVNDENGAMLGLMYAVSDRTDVKKIEEQLRHSQKMEAIGNLTGGLAHDFNNLLGIIIGNLDLLLDLKAGDTDVEEFAREALAAATRGADLNRRLLAFARKQPLNPQRCDVNELVGGITQLLRRTLGEDIEVALELGGNVWPVVVDPAQLESSLTNLANNARDAMSGGGRLMIATSNRYLDEDYCSQHAELAPGRYVLVEITDNGRGMAPNILTHIFEPFFTTKEPGKGTGLGLSMVFGFMKQSGGHLNVYSEIGIGTTFRLYLRAAPSNVDAAVEAEIAPAPPGHGETVLVVEDNPSLRRVVVRQLSELGYCVLEAEDAQAALRLLEQRPVQLLLTDLVMPGEIGGSELAYMATARWPGLKVLLTSGFPEKKYDSSNLVPAQLLSKPYRKEDLARATYGALHS